MARIVGPSGIIAVVDDGVAASLVNEGDAEYVKDAPKSAPTKEAPKNKK